MPATGKPGERPPLPRHPQAVLLPPPALRPSQRGRLLVTVWLGGLLSATGIGVLRDGFHSLVSGGGALVGVVLLIVLGLCVVCQVLALLVTRRQVSRVRPEPGTAAGTTAAVLLLGGAAVIALNVDWPGGEQSALAAGPFGTQVTVFFQDSNIDGFSDGVVTVSPAGTDPCRDLTVIANYETEPDGWGDESGETLLVPDPLCTADGRGPAGPGP